MISEAMTNILLGLSSLQWTSAGNDTHLSDDAIISLKKEIMTNLQLKLPKQGKKVYNIFVEVEADFIIKLSTLSMIFESQ